ncbi:acetyl-CoA hydrolase/transferase C-terminal domain-containing protein [Acidaminococcus massiliensis]|uniref:acetyl-CoA hydrolase/transferase C-terminal domain-containing protein n=1 Tax=Acidaminococcus massiliensis TaxID=1852375 RepID=UPI0022E81C66|nr:acetyl-CoA hydrolase/transferase C-terminal domain-containing protein [Acidaminococcus massiliensis]
MERIPEKLRTKVMSADDAARLIQPGMTIAVSGFTRTNYPKAVPQAVTRQGTAKGLTLIVGAAVGDCIDGAWTRAGLLKRRYGHQSNKDLRKAVNGDQVEFSDIHISHLPKYMNERTGPHIDIALIECCAITEEGLYLGASGGTADAAVRNADKVIVEVNRSLPLGFMGMHDIFEVGVAPASRIIPISHPQDRIGTPYIPCPLEKIAAVVFTDEADEAQTFKAVTPATAKIAENIVDFLKNEIQHGRLPENPGPLQSGVGSVGNAVLAGLATSGFHHLNMYTEVMQDAALGLLDQGVLDFISTSSVALTDENRKRFYETIQDYHDKILIRPNEISNHPEVIRRLGVISLNTPIEVDLYGNVNSTHIDGTAMMNGLGGSGDFARNARISIFASESVAKHGAISSIVPFVSHVDQTEHDVDVIVTEQGIADLRWLTPKERARVLIDHCAHPDYRPMLEEYYQEAYASAKGKHTPHVLEKAFSWHLKYLQTGSMK